MCFEKLKELTPNEIIDVLLTVVGLFGFVTLSAIHVVYDTTDLETYFVCGLSALVTLFGLAFLKMSQIEKRLLKQISK